MNLKVFFKMSPELCLTIPIYNEEECIEKSVSNLVEKFEKEKLDYELVLVNNGSVDKTGEILEKLSKKNNRLRIVTLKENAGFGGGIMKGFENSNGKYIGFDCADGEIPVEEVFKVFEIAKKSNEEIVKARRIKRKTKFFRQFTSFVFNTLILFRFNLKIKDMNGYPIFIKKENYERLEINRKDFYV